MSVSYRRTYTPSATPPTPSTSNGANSSETAGATCWGKLLGSTSPTAHGRARAAPLSSSSHDGRLQEEEEDADERKFIAECDAIAQRQEAEFGARLAASEAVARGTLPAEQEREVYQANLTVLGVPPAPSAGCAVCGTERCRSCARQLQATRRAIETANE